MTDLHLSPEDGVDPEDSTIVTDAIVTGLRGDAPVRNAEAMERLAEQNRQHQEAMERSRIQILTIDMLETKFLLEQTRLLASRPRFYGAVLRLIADEFAAMDAAGNPGPDA